MPQPQDCSKLLSLDNVHFPCDQLLREFLQCLRTILAILAHLIPAFQQHQPLLASSESPDIHPQITLQILCEFPLFEANRGLNCSISTPVQPATQKISGTPAKTKEDIRFDPDPGCSLRLLAFQVSESFMLKELILVSIHLMECITLLTSAFNFQKQLLKKMVLGASWGFYARLYRVCSNQPFFASHISTILCFCLLLSDPTQLPPGTLRCGARGAVFKTLHWLHG